MTLRMTQAQADEFLGNKKPRRKLVQHEHLMQVALFDRIRAHENQYPDFRFIAAIPNGGMRNKVVANKLQAEGVRSGVLDIMWPIPAYIWHGLFIEMKHGKGKLSEHQSEWFNHLLINGYRVEVCYSEVEAWTTIWNYYLISLEKRADG